MLTSKEELYRQLMDLCDNNECFYYTDHVDFNGTLYRIFNYRIASYEDFLKPGALNCRGIMYRLNPDSTTNLVSRPMKKFFNLGENPFTIDLDLKKVGHIEVKEDGSLISTYLDVDGVMRLKSKGSLSSDQAIDASVYLTNNPDYYREVSSLVEAGYTVNFEWCSPDNRIVLDYKEEKLIPLNYINNSTGQVYHIEYEKNSWKKEKPIMSKMAVRRLDFSDVNAVLDAVRTSEGSEGIIMYLIDHSGDISPVKVKSEWYVDLHRIKDSLNHTRHLYNAIIHDNIDDAIAMLSDDDTMIQRINKMKDHVHNKVATVMSEVLSYYNENKRLSRKDFAVGANNIYAGPVFHMIMSTYKLGSDGIDLIGWLEKNMDFMLENYSERN